MTDRPTDPLNDRLNWMYTLTSYIIFYLPIQGLLTATVSSEVFQAAQPALLYLVPFTLLPLLVMAYLKVLLEILYRQILLCIEDETTYLIYSIVY